jgi:hypothetical protein
MMEVTIRDDSAFRLKPPGVPDQVWGPYRFVPGTGPGMGTRRQDGADAAGRRTRTVEEMPVGDAHLYALEHTPYPSTFFGDTAEWRSQVGTIVKLRIDTSKAGWTPWVAVGELETRPDVATTTELT